MLFQSRPDHELLLNVLKWVQSQTDKGLNGLYMSKWEVSLCMKAPTKEEPQDEFWTVEVHSNQSCCQWLLQLWLYLECFQHRTHTNIRVIQAYNTRGYSYSPRCSTVKVDQMCRGLDNAYGEKTPLIPQVPKIYKWLSETLHAKSLCLAIILRSQATEGISSKGR